MPRASGQEGSRSPCREGHVASRGPSLHCILPVGDYVRCHSSFSALHPQCLVHVFAVVSLLSSSTSRWFIRVASFVCRACGVHSRAYLWLMLFCLALRISFSRLGKQRSALVTCTLGIAHWVSLWQPFGGVPPQTDQSDVNAQDEVLLSVRRWSSSVHSFQADCVAWT